MTPDLLHPQTIVVADAPQPPTRDTMCALCYFLGHAPLPLERLYWLQRHLHTPCPTHYGREMPEAA